MTQRIKRRKKRRIVSIFVVLSNAKFQNGVQFDGIFDFEYFKILLYFRFQIFQNFTLFLLSNILKIDFIFAFKYFKIQLYF